MSEKPEYVVINHMDASEAAAKLNELATEGYELAATMAGDVESYPTYVLRLRPEVRLAQEENQYWQNRVAALSVMVEALEKRLAALEPVPFCPSCGGTGRHTVGLTENGMAISAGCPTCDGTGRGQGHE